MLFITSLPVKDNDGRSTARARSVLLANLGADGVRVSRGRRAYGIWFDDDGNRYAEETRVYVLDGSEAAIKRALCKFGEDARQLAVLCVPITGKNDAVVGRAEGEAGADALARKHGGATLFIDTGVAESYEYAALEAGVDYALPVAK